MATALREPQQQFHVLFSIWDHPRIPCVSKNMDASCRRKATTAVREPGNEHDRFTVAELEDETLCTVSDDSVVFLGCPGPFCLLRWWFSARFPRYRKQSILRELVEVVCNTHFCLSSLSILSLALLLDSFYKRFLIMHHISNVAS